MSSADSSWARLRGAGSSAQGSVTTCSVGHRGVGGRSSGGRGHVILTADSRCCTTQLTQHCKTIIKTQNSGLRSKEEKPRDPINQLSRCNTQEGLLSVAQTGDSDLLGGRAPPTANWASFYGQKKHIISILHTGYKVIGYMFAKQSYWYKLRGLLFKLKAILLVQTGWAFVQT